ncbi:MAG TPA: hypothetical protein DHU63_06005 [Candidatus Marinimicrobia bacterium]|nr:MAG: hypothetical protein AUJ47_11250 [Candidatus Marinimicrobia bacterium CG1_02_48_14]PIZ68371.1 MAG: hypothetical protein COY19_03940 [Candidatus Marinimicrobia bacterium CG_4_10_14_0_2_um_filter_48_9]HCW76076.1 hypothetical protein [Candidatus Neomarinimicrobiota bacterium]
MLPRTTIDLNFIIFILPSSALLMALKYVICLELERLVKHGNTEFDGVRTSGIEHAGTFALIQFHTLYSPSE